LLQNSEERNDLAGVLKKAQVSKSAFQKGPIQK
jgi:hypothetical protein